ncbi:MAG: hypothetical protein WCO29_07950 [Nostocales cyanobacterium ELA583]|jgi:hypothetical protein
MLLRPNWLQIIGTTFLGYIWFTTALSVTSASAADEIASENHSRKELITNQIALKKNLPDLKEVVAKNMKSQGKIESLLEQKQPQFNAQTETPVPANSQINSDKLRQDLLIEPLVKVIPAKQTYSPSLTFATPSAFGAGWGDIFFGASAATSGKARTQPDGSISMGFGLGNARKLIGLELAYNIGSIKNFGYNGTFDLKANRILYAKNNTQIAAAVGWRTFAQHVKSETIRPSGVFGLVTSYSLLKPNDPVNKMPISFSLGAGGGDFRTGNASTGVFAGVGVQVHPQIGVGMGWSGVGFNVGASFVPIPTIPLTINAVGADLTNHSQGGTVFVLSIGYGFNFLPK